MHGNRVAANGDIRFEQTRPMVPVSRLISREPDGGQHYHDRAGLSGPVKTPEGSQSNDLSWILNSVTGSLSKAKGRQLLSPLTDRPVPERFAGKVCLTLNCFPALVREARIMDDKNGIFPEQPNGPVLKMPQIISIQATSASLMRRRISGARLAAIKSTARSLPMI